MEFDRICQEKGTKTRTCGRREPQVRIFIWLLIGLDGTCKSSSARWPEENACLLLGEGAVIILQELSQLFHIENFLSVEEDGFEGSGFLILRRYGNNPSGIQPVFSYQDSLSVWSEWRKWNIRNSRRKSDSTSAASQWARSKCSVSWIKTSYFLCFMWLFVLKFSYSLLMVLS